MSVLGGDGGDGMCNIKNWYLHTSTCVDVRQSGTACWQVAMEQPVSSLWLPSPQMTRGSFVHIRSETFISQQYTKIFDYSILIHNSNDKYGERHYSTFGLRELKCMISDQDCIHDDPDCSIRLLKNRSFWFRIKIAFLWKWNLKHRGHLNHHIGWHCPYKNIILYHGKTQKSISRVCVGEKGKKSDFPLHMVDRFNENLMFTWKIMPDLLQILFLAFRYEIRVSTLYLYINRSDGNISHIWANEYAFFSSPG